MKQTNTPTLYEKLVKLTETWGSITGVNVILGSIVYKPETGVAFLTGLFHNSKILDYYANEDKSKYEEVQQLKKQKGYKTVLKEVYFSVSYDVQDKETPPSERALRAHYYIYPNSKTAKNKKYQKIATQLTKIVLYAAINISLSIYDFAWDVNLTPAEKTYLIDPFEYIDAEI